MVLYVIVYCTTNMATVSPTSEAWKYNTDGKAESYAAVVISSVFPDMTVKIDYITGVSTIMFEADTASYLSDNGPMITDTGDEYIFKAVVRPSSDAKNPGQYVIIYVKTGKIATPIYNNMSQYSFLLESMQSVSPLDVRMYAPFTALPAGQLTTIPLNRSEVVTSGNDNEPRISQNSVLTSLTPLVSVDIVVSVNINGVFLNAKGTLTVGEVRYDVLITRVDSLYTALIGNTSTRAPAVVDGNYTVGIFPLTFPIPITLAMRVPTNDINLPVEISASAVVSVSGNQPNNVTIDNGTNALLVCSQRSEVRVNIDLQFTIMGTDIGDTLCVVRGTKQYFPRLQFPRELIGVTQEVHVDYDPGVSNFTFQPDYVSVMKGCGCTAWQRAKSARACDPKGYTVAGQSDVVFYRNVCAFMVFRYYLAGLSSGKFNVRWLLRENTEKFYHNLLHSDFREFIEVFTTYGFSKYERYMKRELC